MTTTTRPRLRDHICVGIRVIDATEQRIFRVSQVWRADSEVLLIARDNGERRRIAWADLKHHYELIQPFTGSLR